MRRILVLLICCSLLLLPGCQKEKTIAEKELHVAAMSGPVTMNPLFVRDAASAEVAALLHAPLMVTDPVTLEPKPRVISAWNYQEETLTYIFSVQPQAVWSDGHPITADDIAFTMRVICHPDYTGWLFLPLRYVLGAEGYKEEHASPFADGDISGLKIIDEHQLSITLKEPYAPFLSMLTFSILPKHLTEGIQVALMERDAYSQRLPVSSGPYQLAEWNPDEYVHVRANPHFFLGRPDIEHIYYRFIANTETQLIEFLAGKIDLIPTAVKVEDVEMLQKNRDIRVYTNPRLVYDYIAIHAQKPESPLYDIRVRKALAMLINRDEMINNVLLGFAEPLCGPLLPNQFAFDQHLRSENYDPAAARRLIVEAGYPNLKLKLIFNAGNVVRENIALLFKEQAAQIGIDIQITLLEWEAFLAAIRDKNFDLAIMGRGVEADPDLTFHWHSEGQGNAFGFANRQVDYLLEQAHISTDKYKRVQLYHEAQQLIVSDIPAIWLYTRRAVHAATADLEHFTAHPESCFYNVHEWVLKNKEVTP